MLNVFLIRKAIRLSDHPTRPLHTNKENVDSVDSLPSNLLKRSQYVNHLPRGNCTSPKDCGPIKGGDGGSLSTQRKTTVVSGERTRDGLAKP